jgi:hypothetical protein
VLLIFYLLLKDTLCTIDILFIIEGHFVVIDELLLKDILLLLISYLLLQDTLAIIY